MHHVLHLSDPHLTGTGRDGDGVDAVSALTGLLHDLRHLRDLDLVVVTGDLADDGSEAGVAGVRDAVAAYAGERGVPHLYTTGNHDDRSSYAAVLGTGHLGVEQVASGPGCAAASTTAGLRVVTLDSLVPGSVHGELDAAQLDWLVDVLTTPSPHGTLVALHHPPISLASLPWQASVALHRPAELAAVLEGSDVRVVLCGHFHHAQSGSIAGVPVWVAPGIVTRIDRTAPPHLDRGVLGAGAGLLELPDAGPPSYLPLVARDPRAGEQVYLVDHASGETVDVE